MFKTIERKAIPQGNKQFEAKRQAIISEVAAKIPPELILPSEPIVNPPLDVTGIPRDCGLLTSDEIDITENYGLVDLVQAIASKRLTSVAVVSAFCKRAITAHQLTFCLTDLYMQEALQRARELDDHLERTGQTIGPLHGIPISIKETIKVERQIWSLGFMATRTIAKEDAPLVSILRNMGAVFYVKTNQPAAVFSPEGTSFLGRTLNPYNINLSSGGSSSGEAALLAMRGSPFGFGTDIGGSIRIPASFCGLYGLKGSSGFLPMSPAGLSPANLSIHNIVGPLSHSLRDLDYMLYHVLAQKPHLLDPACLPIPYTGLGTTKHKSGLKVGILKSYGLIRPQPPSLQAIEWAEAQARNHGFLVTDFKFYQPARAHKLFHELVMHDGMKLANAAFKAGNEPHYPVFDDLISHALDLVDESALETEETAIAIATKRYQRDVYREEFLADWMAQGNPDIVICPMSAASPHDTGNLRHNASHTHFWNVLDYPAMAVPTYIRAGPRTDYPQDQDEDLQPLSGDDEAATDLWRMHDYSGAPISLQVVAKRHMENELLAAVGMIQQALQLP
ncbi:unnamed protein product [Zymoseptoria tritici ST99CH_3D1]|nr:unnamed protein product [Zymoseptoria tritici ST99CH_3D1]